MELQASGILLTTAYLPPVSWVKTTADAGIVTIEACESYSRQTYRNRCRLISANGLISLSVPVVKQNGKKPKTRDIKIFYGEPWQRLHWRTIDAAYSNSPFYLYYKDDLMPFFNQKYQFLIDLNTAICEKLFEIIGIDVKMQLSEEYYAQPEGIIDLRNVFSPKNNSGINLPSYHQVFEERHGFIPDLSIIDLLFNEGPATKEYLNSEL